MASKERKCSVCKKKGPYQMVGLKVVCYSEECFSELIADAKRKGQRKLEAERRKQEKQENAELRQKKEQAKTLSQLCTRAQEDVNKYLRLLDIYLGYNCISCGVRPVEQGGHYYHAGTKWRVNRFRFSHLIIHGQCVHCNHYSPGGNHKGFTEGLIQRYGPEYVDNIEQLKLRAERNELESLDKDEVRQIGLWHRQQSKILQDAIKRGEKPNPFYGRLLNQW